MSVTDGTDIYTKQLELGGHVGAHKRNGRFVTELRRNAAGHLVTRRNQTKYAAIPGRAFADSVNVGIAATALAVDGDTATGA